MHLHAIRLSYCGKNSIKTIVCVHKTLIKQPSHHHEHAGSNRFEIQLQIALITAKTSLCPLIGQTSPLTVGPLISFYTWVDLLVISLCVQTDLRSNSRSSKYCKNNLPPFIPVKSVDSTIWDKDSPIYILGLVLDVFTRSRDSKDQNLWSNNLNRDFMWLANCLRPRLESDD